MTKHECRMPKERLNEVAIPSSSQYERAFSVQSLRDRERQRPRRAQPGRERIRCDPRDSRLIVQPIRSSAARTLRALAEPHWLMPLQLKKLSRSLARFRHARCVLQERAMPAFRRATRPLRVYSHMSLRPVFGESPQSSGHPSLAQSQWRKPWLAKN